MSADRNLPRKPPVQQPSKPLDVDGVAVMKVGTMLWSGALIALLVTGTRLPSDNGWWLWTCAAGVFIGVLLLAYSSRRARVYQAARLSESTANQE